MEKDIKESNGSDETDPNHDKKTDLIFWQHLTMFD